MHDLRDQSVPIPVKGLTIQHSQALCLMKDTAALARFAERVVRSAGCWTILALLYLHSYTGHGTNSKYKKQNTVCLRDFGTIGYNNFMKQLKCMATCMHVNMVTLGF